MKRISQFANNIINKDYTRNTLYSLSSNIITTFVSLLMVLIIPRKISVEQYGYFQLYLFYLNYVGILQFGWCDGIYLRLGGEYYSELDKHLYSTQFWLLVIAESFICGVVYFFVGTFINDDNLHYVLVSLCFVSVGRNVRWFVIYLLQATARIKDYAAVIISEKCIFVLLTILAFILGHDSFRTIILLDVVANFCSLFIGMHCCHDAVFSGFYPSRSVFSEVLDNVSAGFKLMMAATCSMLITSVVRLGIQLQWDVSTFGKISLTINISNMLMALINAIAMVMYPMLRRTSSEHLLSIYKLVRTMLISGVMGIMAFYYPLQSILSAWLPQYAESLRYAAILFPICVYESKMSMLINTYFKTLRLEKQLMRCNMAALALSVILTVLATAVLHNVTLAIVSILICLVFRGVISELLLSKHIAIEVKRDIVIELCMTIAFIICNWYFGFAGMLMYAGCYVLYLLIKKNDIMETVSFIKSMR